jgi:PAS domain S-box-containing protein
LSVVIQSGQYPRLDADLVKADGTFVNCRIDITSLSESNDRYLLCEIRDFSYFDKEVRSARVIQSVYSILISDDYWYTKVQNIAELIRTIYNCSMVYFFLQWYEGFYNYGSVDEDLSASMKKFYFDKELEISTEYKKDICAIFLKIKTGAKQYGTLCIKLQRNDIDDTTIDTLMNACRVIAQYVESTILIGELKNSENTYRVLSENSFIGIAILQDMKILYVNPRLIEISGYSAEELVGQKHPGPFFHPDTKDRIVEAVNNEFQTTDRLSIQNTKAIRKNGQPCYVSLYYNKIEYRRKQAALLQISDVTYEVEAEEQKERITQLLIKDQKMKTLKNLVSGLSHEFNNVFAIIKGYVELMSYNPDVADKIDEDLKVIHEATQRGIDITNRMHVFIRHDKLKQNEIDLKIFFEVSRSLLLNLIHKKNPRMDFTIDLDQNATSIIADEFGLEEIFYNLIMNSLDAIDDNGEITIRSKRVNDDYCSIEFTDNGKGISPDILDSIFDPFFTTKDPDEGTGLGLYIVYELVKSMNGDIVVESEPGKGATFRIMFPTSKS